IPKEPGTAPAAPSPQSAFNAIASEIRGAPGDIVKPGSPGNSARVAGFFSSGNHGEPTRRWRKPLLRFASVGAAASVSIAIYLLGDPGTDPAGRLGTPARGGRGSS